MKTETHGGGGGGHHVVAEAIGATQLQILEAKGYEHHQKPGGDTEGFYLEFHSGK